MKTGESKRKKKGNMWLTDKEKMQEGNHILEQDERKNITCCEGGECI